MALAEANICLRVRGKLNAALETKHCSFSYESYSVAHDVSHTSCKIPHIFHIAFSIVLNTEHSHQTLLPSKPSNFWSVS